MAIKTEESDNLGIVQLTNCNLLGNIRKGLVYPVTATHAVKSLDFDGEPIEGVECCLEDRLQAIEKKIGISGGCTCSALTSEQIESLIGKVTESDSDDDNDDSDCVCTAISEEAVESLL